MMGDPNPYLNRPATFANKMIGNPNSYINQPATFANNNNMMGYPNSYINQPATFADNNNNMGYPNSYINQPATFADNNNMMGCPNSYINQPATFTNNNMTGYPNSYINQPPTFANNNNMMGYPNYYINQPPTFANNMTGYPNSYIHQPPTFANNNNMMGYPNPPMNQPPTSGNTFIPYPISHMNYQQAQAVTEADNDPNFVAAVFGDIQHFRRCDPEDLKQMFFKSNDCILHVHIKRSDRPSPDFTKEILEIFPSLLYHVNEDDDTLLHSAAEYGRSAIAEVLLKCARNPSQGSENGQRTITLTEMLNMKNRDGETALEKALEHEESEVLKILIKEAEPQSLDFARHFPKIIDLTKSYKDSEMFDAVVAKSHEGMTGLCEAFMINHFEGMHSNNNTFLHCFLESYPASFEIVKKILERYPISPLEANSKGNTLLHIAAKLGYSAMVEFLLNLVRDQPQEGAESGETSNSMMLINKKNSKGQTAVDKAARKGKAEVLKQLIDEAETSSLDFADYFPKIIEITEAYKDEEMMNMVIAKSRNGIAGLLEVLERNDYEGTESHDTFLHWYVREAESPSTEFVKKMLDVCPSIPLLKVNGKGNTLLHIAISCKHVPIVELLLQRAREQLEDGERIDAKMLISMQNKKGKTALDKAFRLYRREIKMLKLLIKEADPDFLCSEENFPKILYIAARREEEGILDLIVEKNRNRTPTLEQLLEDTVVEGGTVLHMSIENHATTDYLKKILNLCPSLLLKVNEEDDTPLHFAALSDKSDTVKCLLDHAKHQRREVITTMLKMKNKDGDTALHLAAKNDGMEVVKALIEDPDILGTRPSKDTLLHVYIESSEKPSAEFMRTIHKICPTLLLTVNDNGDTPLHVATKCGHVEIVKVLLEITKPQDPKSEQRDDWKRLHMKNKEGNTALHEALLHEKYDVAQTLIEAHDSKIPSFANEAKETPLYLAADKGYDEVVFKILKKGRLANDQHQGPNGLTTLHAAVKNRDDTSLQIMRKLLEKNNSLPMAQDQYGWTPLHYAAYYGHINKVSLLLEFDQSAASISDQQREMTPLHMAASQGYKDIIEIIFSKCEDCRHKEDKKGWNLLHFAMLSLSKEELFNLLKDPSIKQLSNKEDKEGNTPFHIRAAAYGDTIFRVEDDLKAVNHEHISVDYVLERGSHKLEETIQILFGDVGDQGQYEKGVIRRRVDVDCKKIQDQRRKRYHDRFEKKRSSNLLVATLIATVTFTAAFTIPGGYNNKEGLGKESLNEGTAILNRNLAFKFFIISDTIAMSLSFSSVFIQFILSFEKFQMHEYLFNIASCLAILSMGTVVVAFVTGIYAVLVPSSWLAITTSLLGLSFFLLVLCSLILIYYRRAILNSLPRCNNCVPIHWKRN